MRNSLISARLGLWQALADHGKLFSRGLANVPLRESKEVNDRIGRFRDMMPFDTGGICNDDVLRRADLILMQGNRSLWTR